MGLYETGASIMWGLGAKTPESWQVAVALQRAKDGLARVAQGRALVLQRPVDLEGVQLALIGADRCFSDIIENLE